MKLFVAFSRAYPVQSALVLGSLVLASLFEGLGLTTLLPLLTARGGDAAGGAPSGVGGVVVRALDFVGLTPTVGVMLMIVVIGMTLKSVLVLVANRQVGYTVAHVATDLRLGFIRSLLSARWEYYLRQPVGALANSLATEATRGAESYLYGATVIALVIQAMVYSIVALLVSWQATLVALAAGAVFVFLLNRLVHMSRRAGAKQTRLLRSLLARLSDNLQSVKPLKAMARENLANALLEGDTTQLNRALRKEIFSKEALRALQEPMLAILIAAGLYVALVRFDMSLASVMLLAFLLVRVLLYLSRMQREYQKMVTCESAYWSLQSVIEGARKESENPPDGATPSLRQAIRLDDVGFRYRDRWVLRNVSLTIPAGGITAIVGASGAGKTTVVDLVTALLRPQEGEIWIDDLPLQRVDWRLWRRMIGYVPAGHAAAARYRGEQRDAGRSGADPGRCRGGTAGGRDLGARFRPAGGAGHDRRRARREALRRPAPARGDRARPRAPAPPADPRRSHQRPRSRNGGRHLPHAAGTARGAHHHRDIASVAAGRRRGSRLPDGRGCGIAGGRRRPRTTGARAGRGLGVVARFQTQRSRFSCGRTHRTVLPNNSRPT